MAVVLADNALTTLATVEEELGITVGGGIADDYLNRMINVYSDFIESSLFRKLKRTAVTDEKVAGYATRYLMVERYPVDTGETTTVKYNDDTIDSTQWEWDNDGEGGRLFNLAGVWYWGAGVANNIARDPVPGTERKRYKVSYTGGYIMPKDWNGTDAFRLPWDIEQLCIEMVATAYRHKGQSRDIKSEKLLSSSVTYFDAADSPRWHDVMGKYRRGGI